MADRIDRRHLIRLAGAGLAAGAALGLAPALLAVPAPRRGDPLDRLADKLDGRMIRPGDPEYELARRVLAAKVDPRPSALVRPASVDDVRRVVDFARARDMPLAVKGGGHGNPGFAVADGGLTLDLSTLADVRADPGAQRVRVGGGARVGAVDRATAPLGLAAPLGECPTVGVAGYALGGGVGLLVAPFGLGCDAIRAAEIVLADDRRLWTDAEREPDLFWALKGGGGNFGVVTRLDLALHPVGRVTAGQLFFDRDARDGLLAFREFAAGAPRTTSAIARVFPGRGGTPICAIRLCDIGRAGDPALAALRRAAGLTRDRLHEMGYADLQGQAPDDLEPFLDETRAGFLPRFDDAIIERLTEAARAAPGGFEIRLTHLHGALTELPPGASAFPIRRPGVDCWISAEWSRPAEKPTALAWLEPAWRSIAPFTRGAYVNGLDGDGPARVRDAYLAAYPRLARLKRRYDPDNMFRYNHNIAPA